MTINMYTSKPVYTASFKSTASGPDAKNDLDILVPTMTAKTGENAKVLTAMQNYYLNVDPMVMIANYHDIEDGIA